MKKLTDILNLVIDFITYLKSKFKIHKFENEISSLDFNKFKPVLMKHLQYDDDGKNATLMF